MGDEHRPFAASVRDQATDADRAGSFGMGDAEDPERFGLSDADERARKERLDAKPEPKRAVTPEERDGLVAGCADAVLAWRGVYGAADLMLRRLGDEIALPVEECERLVREELARRAYAGAGGEARLRGRRGGAAAVAGALRA